MIHTRLDDDKKDLRATLLRRRLAMPPEARLAADQAIRERCARLAESRARAALCLYWPVKNEPDLLPLARAMLQAGRTVAFPAVRGDDMVFRIVRDLEQDMAPARFGIPEPKDHCPALAETGERLLFVPGLGFDPAGNRLGYGKGYFDRYLARAGGISAGIAYDACILPRVPSGENDHPMRFIVSEARCLEIPSVTG